MQDFVNVVGLEPLRPLGKLKGISIFIASALGIGLVVAASCLKAKVKLRALGSR